MPSKRNNKLSYQQAAKQRDWAEESRAGTISENYPEVRSIEIKANYTPEQSWECEPGSKNRSYLPESKAYFKIDCPFRECIAGGLNIDSEVRAMIRSRIETKASKESCDGWQDESRIGRHKCFLKWDYSISIKYQ